MEENRRKLIPKESLAFRPFSTKECASTDPVQRFPCLCFYGKNEHPVLALLFTLAEAVQGKVAEPCTLGPCAVFFREGAHVRVDMYMSGPTSRRIKAGVYLFKNHYRGHVS